MFKTAITAFLLVAAAANAEVVTKEYAEPWIDFKLLFQQHAANLVMRAGPEAETTVVLELTEEISVTRLGPDSAPLYLTRDLGPEGPIGCVLEMLVDLNEMAGNCPGFASAEQAAAVQMRLGMVQDFVAANTVPATNSTDLAAMLPKRAAQCSDATRRPYLNDQLASVLSDRFLAELLRSVAKPRLPVRHPCRY